MRRKERVPYDEKDPRLLQASKATQWRARQRGWWCPGYMKPREIKTCLAPNCPRDATIHGLCDKHYEQFRRHGILLGPTRQRTANPSTCRAPGCTQRAFAKGYCGKHYMQIKRYGKLSPQRERRPQGQKKEIGAKVPRTLYERANERRVKEGIPSFSQLIRTLLKEYVRR